MIKMEIDYIEFFVDSNVSILEACESLGIDVPRFCYHQSLSVAGNCRMCLVELLGSPKPVASCALSVSNNMKIFIDSPLVKKARENVLEFLLLNHPLDCPICDQGGECDLQDQVRIFGIDSSRFFFNKRTVEDKNCGPVIKTIMTRCIHCTRCVRFNSEISQDEFFGTLNRGVKTEIGPYLEDKSNSSFLSGNVIDLCPVGALTSKQYSFKARPWELFTKETIDVTDGFGANIYVSTKESEILRIFPKLNKELNERFITDKTRFYFDSNKQNRILEPISKTSKKFFDEKIRDFLSLKKKKITILINNTLDLDGIFLVKCLEKNNNKESIYSKDVILEAAFSKHTSFYTPPVTC
jgi:NADH-quinone oxidoreductase subunit G